MEITKREIIFSITIIAVFLIIGILISNKITESQADANEKYNKALKIDDAELFQYGMDTNVGNAFVYGDFVAIDTVAYSDIKGEYLYAEKVTEKYTKHTRIETYYSGSGKSRTSHTRIVHYWTWDIIDSESKCSKEVTFCGVIFQTVKFDIPSPDYLDTIDGGYHLRYVYYGYPVSSKGTIFAYLTNGSIKGDNNNLYKDLTIESTYNMLISEYGELIFWIIWVIVIIGCVYGFYYIDNRWLEN